MIADYIDPQWGLTRRQRKQAHDIARWRYVALWRLLVVVPLISVCGFLAFHFGVRLVPRWLGVDKNVLGTAMVFAVGSVALWCGAALMVHWIYARPIRSAVRHLGYDVCVTCGYWLRGLGDDVMHCPECGATREPMPSPDRQS